MTITYSNLLINRTGINSQVSLEFGYIVHFALELLALECLSFPYMYLTCPCIATKIFKTTFAQNLLITGKIIKSQTYLKLYRTIQFALELLALSVDDE